MNKIKILFVCTENVFRSYSAQVLTEKYLKDNNILNIKIDSCGTVANPFEKPYMQTISQLKELGIDKNILLNHKNKKVNLKLLKENDLIICMTNSHKKYIKDKFYINSYLFNEIVYNKKTDLKDDVETNLIGINNSLDSFLRNTVEYINKSIPKLIENIKKSHMN